jgi:peptide subunit release factor 1 (eRF1)
MATDSHLVISEIEVRNLGLGGSGEHKPKEVKKQYVTVSLKGLCINIAPTIELAVKS